MHFVSSIASSLSPVRRTCAPKKPCAKKIKALYEKLQISSIEQLLQACESGRVAQLPGFGETTQEKLCKAIAERTKHAGSFQLCQIANEAETLKRDLAASTDALHVDVAGSYRRHREV